LLINVKTTKNNVTASKRPSSLNLPDPRPPHIPAPTGRHIGNITSKGPIR
jgi:hypothetical protein